MSPATKKTSTSLKHFLAWVASVSEKTRFVSRGDRAKGVEDRMTPTAVFVFRLLTMDAGDPPALRRKWARRAVRYAPTERHVEEAERIIAWARATEPAYTDKVVYQTQLRWVATLGVVTRDTVGFAAGLYRSYWLEKRAAQDEILFREKLEKVLLPAAAGTGEDDGTPE